MDYTSAALSYALLLIPMGFAIAIIAQGAYRLSKKDMSGKMILIFGVIFFILVPAAYFLLTKV